MLQPSTLCVPACRLPEVPTWYTVHGALKLVLEFYNGLVRQFFTLASAHRRLRPTVYLSKIYICSGACHLEMGWPAGRHSDGG